MEVLEAELEVIRITTNHTVWTRNSYVIHLSGRGLGKRGLYLDSGGK